MITGFMYNTRSPIAKKVHQVVLLDSPWSIALTGAVYLPGDPYNHGNLAILSAIAVVLCG